MPYHVRITLKSDPSHDEVKLDLTEKLLEEKILLHYRKGSPIVIKGRTIPIDDIDRICITLTDETSEKILPIVRRERASSTVITPISDEWYIADRGKDVTDDFITEPPSHEKVSLSEVTSSIAKDHRNVLVVHGRNLKARDALFSFLGSINLKPLEFSQAIKATGKGSPYIGEILKEAFSMAQAIVVLMTPDDEARLQKYFIKEDDPIHERELTPQPKQNVLFEAGMAMGRSENRTILVELGNLRPFSDVYGRHVIRLDNSPEKRKELAQRIQNVGCPVDLSGNHWFTAGGDFNQIIKDFETKQTVDEIELRILKITKKEPSITTNRVADELGIKVSELMTRLNRLEKSGLIRVVMHPEVNDTFGGLYITIKGIEELNRYIKAE